MLAAHGTQSIVGRVLVLVVSRLQCVGQNCHLERIGDVDDLRGEVVSCAPRRRISLLLRFLRSIEINQFFYKNVSVSDMGIVCEGVLHCRVHI